MHGDGVFWRDKATFIPVHSIGLVDTRYTAYPVWSAVVPAVRRMNINKY